MGISFNLELPFSLLSCLDSPGQMSLDKSSDMSCYINIHIIITTETEGRISSS